MYVFISSVSTSIFISPVEDDLIVRLSSILKLPSAKIFPVLVEVRSSDFSPLNSLMVISPVLETSTF